MTVTVSAPVVPSVWPSQFYAPYVDMGLYPPYNLARVYWAKEMYRRALQELEETLAVQPGFAPAERAIEALKRKIH